jgi:hypothetical protein
MAKTTGMPTRAEMSALWRCIEDSALMNRQMKVPDDTQEQIDGCREIVRVARRAYLKINKLRRASLLPDRAAG